MLVAVAYLEVLYLQMVLAVGDVSRMHLPGFFSDMDERWLDIYVGGRYVVRILVELRLGIQRSVDRQALGVVVVAQRCHQGVVGSCSLHVQGRANAAHRSRLDARIHLQCVALGVHLQGSAAVVAAVVAEGRQLCREVYRAVEV